MQFIINVLPNGGFTPKKIKQFILNIENQHCSNVTLVFKRTASLDQSAIQVIKHAFINTVIVDHYQDVRLGNETNYWINLAVTDCLLPNAIIQWEQVIKRHPGSAIIISYLRNDQSLIAQTSAIIKQIRVNSPVELQTVKDVMRLPVTESWYDLSFSQQLSILMGLQSYNVINTLNRFQCLTDFRFGSNCLIKVSKRLLNRFDHGMLSQIFNFLLNQPEAVKINLPTIIFSNLTPKVRLKWLNEMIKLTNQIGLSTLKDDYRKFINHQVVIFKKSTSRSFTNHRVIERMVTKVNHQVKQFLKD